MKNLFKIAFSAFAVLALANCTDNLDSTAPEVSGGKHKLTLNAALGEESRTVVGDLNNGKYPVTWSTSGESLQLVEYINLPSNSPQTYTSEEYSLTDGDKKADFLFDLNKRTLYGDETAYYVAAYPAGPSATLAPANNRFNVNIPNEQTPAAASVDPAGVFLVSSTGTGYKQQPLTLDLQFEHVVAFAHMTVKNLGMPEVKTVTFSAPLGSKITGMHEYNYNMHSGDGALTNTYNSVTLNLDNVKFADEFDLWFTLAPCRLTEFTVSFSDGADKVYTKVVDASTNPLQFFRGQVSSFAVDMDGIDDQEETETYTLIKTDALPAKNEGSGIVADLPETSWTPIVITTTVGNTTYVLNTTLTDGRLTMTSVENAVSGEEITVAPSKYQWDVVNRTAGYTFRSKGNGYLNTSGWLAPQYSTSFSIEKVDDSGNYYVKTGSSYLTLADGILDLSNSATTKFQFYSTAQAVADQEQKEEEEKNKPVEKQSYNKVTALTAGKEYILITTYMFADYIVNNNNLAVARCSDVDFAKSGNTFEGDGTGYTFKAASVAGGLFSLQSTATNSYIGTSFSTNGPALGALYKPFNYTSTDGLYYSSGGTFYLYYYAGTLGYINSGYTGNRVHIYEKQ